MAVRTPRPLFSGVEGVWVAGCDSRPGHRNLHDSLKGKRGGGFGGMAFRTVMAACRRHLPERRQAQTRLPGFIVPFVFLFRVVAGSGGRPLPGVCQRRPCSGPFFILPPARERWHGTGGFLPLRRGSPHGLSPHGFQPARPRQGASPLFFFLPFRVFGSPAGNAPVAQR